MCHYIIYLPCSSQLATTIYFPYSKAKQAEKILLSFWPIVLGMIAVSSLMFPHLPLISRTLFFKRLGNHEWFHWADKRIVRLKLAGALTHSRLPPPLWRSHEQRFVNHTEPKKVLLGLNPNGSCHPPVAADIFVSFKIYPQKFLSYFSSNSWSRSFLSTGLSVIPI